MGWIKLEETQFQTSEPERVEMETQNEKQKEIKLRFVQW